MTTKISTRPASWRVRLCACFLSLMAVLVFMSATATAQLAGKGQLTGRIADSTGAAIPNATITAAGFQKLVQKNVHINALESQTLSPNMTVGQESITVNVDAQPPQLETSNATLGATMEQDLYSALPIEMGAYGQPDQRRATD